MIYQIMKDTFESIARSVTLYQQDITQMNVTGTFMADGFKVFDEPIELIPSSVYYRGDRLAAVYYVVDEHKNIFEVTGEKDILDFEKNVHEAYKSGLSIVDAFVCAEFYSE